MSLAHDRTVVETAPLVTALWQTRRHIVNPRKRFGDQWPDLPAWMESAYSIEFEYKMSLADFKADLNKPHRRDPKLRRFHELVYVAPLGILEVTDVVPTGASLVVLTKNGDDWSAHVQYESPNSILAGGRGSWIGAKALLEQVKLLVAFDQASNERAAERVEKAEAVCEIVNRAIEYVIASGPTHGRELKRECDFTNQEMRRVRKAAQNREASLRVEDVMYYVEDAA